MSNYIYVASELQGIHDCYMEGMALAGEHLQAVGERAKALIESSRFKGQTADSVKEYLQSAYMTLIGLFSEVITNSIYALDCYIGEYHGVTSGTDYKARIATGELSMIVTKYADLDREMEKIDNAFHDTIKRLNNNGDIDFTYQRMSTIPSAIKAQQVKLTGLVTSIETIESSSKVDHLTGVLDRLRQMLDYLTGKDPRNFDAAAYQQMLVDIGIGQAYEKMNEVAVQQEEQVVAVENNFLAMNEKKRLDEIEERKKEAGFWGAVVDVACAVVTVAATATLGPVGAIVVGAAAGAVKSAVHEGLDQYVQTGAGLGQMDWGRIGIKALTGGVSGALTSAIGVGAGAATKAIGTLSSPVIKTTLNMGTGVLQNTAGTLVKHSTDALDTGLILLHEGKSWDDAWSKAGDVFKADLGKDMVKSVATGLTSNLGGLTGDMKDGLAKSATNVVISTGAGVLDYTVETALEGEEWKLQDAMAAGGKKATGAVVKETFSYLRSDSLPISKWEQSKGSGGLKYALSFAGGGIENYLSKNGGACVEALIKGDDDALDNLKLFDKDGNPTSAIYNLATGGTQNTAKLAYDKHLAPGVETEKTFMREKKDENGQPIIGSDGKPVMEEVKQTTTVYGTKLFGGTKKVVSETTTETSVDKYGTKTTTENTVYYENGKEIGSGTSTTTVNGGQTEAKTQSTTVSSSEYTRSDGTTVSSSGRKTTTADRSDGTVFTHEETRNETHNNRRFDHSGSKEETVSDTLAGRDTTITDKTTDKESYGLSGRKNSETITHTDETVREGDTTTTEKTTTKETYQKNDFVDGERRREVETTTTRTVDEKTKAQTTASRTDKPSGNGYDKGKEHTSNDITHSYTKRDDKSAVGRMKTNESIIGGDRYEPDGGQSDLQKQQEDQEANLRAQFRNRRSAQDLGLT